MRNQFGVIDLDERGDGCAGLGDYRSRRLFCKRFDVAPYGKFGSEADIKHGVHAHASQPPVELQQVAVKTGRRRRRHDGHNGFSVCGISEEFGKIIYVGPGLVGAGLQAAAAADAHVVDDVDVVAAAVVAEFYGADGDAHVAVDALVLIHMNQWREFSGCAL